MIVYHAVKGFCLAPSGTRADPDVEELLPTSGLELLRMDSLLPDEVASQSEDDTTPTTKRKLSKLEKKELRQQKKINAARTRQAKRQASTEDVVVSTDLGPFQTKSEIRAYYTKIIQRAGRSSKDEFKLFQYHSIALYKSDLEHILPGEWLNDNNLSVIYEMINVLVLQSNELFKQQIHMLYPSVVHLFMHFPVKTPEDAAAILPLDELSKLRFIFIPVNFIDDDDALSEEVNVGDHWALCVFSALENKLYVYDSMAVEDDTICDNFVQELSTRLTKTLVQKPITTVKMNCDQQTNCDDCGVFLVMITCVLIHMLTSRESMDFNMDGVRLLPLRARLEMMQLMYRLGDER